MSEAKKGLLEEYILSENKADFIKKLAPNSEERNYIEIVTALNEKKFTPELEAGISAYLNNNYYKHEDKNFVRLNYLTQKLQTAEKAERKGIIQEINKHYISTEFNHQKPPVAISNNGIFGQTEVLAHELTDSDAKNMMLQTYLDNLYKNKTIQDLRQILPNYNNLIDLNRFNQLQDVELLQEMFNTGDRMYKAVGVVDFLKNFPNTQQNYSPLKQMIFEKLTLDQQNQLLEDQFFLNNPHCIETYINGKFIVHQRLNNPEEGQIEAKARTREFLEFTRGLPKKYERYISMNLLKILVLNLQTEEFDEKVFIEYLENPLDMSAAHFNYEYKTAVTQKQKNNSQVSIRAPDFTGGQDVILEHLNHFLASEESLNRYAQYFDPQYLNTIYYSNKLIRGDDVKEANTVLGEASVKALHSKKALNIQKNKRSFKHGEKVQIHAEIKNIGELRVRVFEVSTANFLVEGGNANYSSIDVTGLIPFEEYKYMYTQAPIVNHKETFEFLSIQDKLRGVYIIDLIGEDLNSRAVIQKGHLTLVNDSQTGRNYIIYDEDNNVCKSSSTGLYVNGKLFTADSNTGIIQLPTNLDVSASSQVILVHEGFADLASLRIQSESYNLATNLIYNSESFITGNEVELLLQVKLSRGARAVSLSKLKDANAELCLVNDSGVVTKIPFKNLTLSDDADLSLKFLLPSKIVRLALLFKASVPIHGISSELSSESHLSFSPDGNQKAGLVELLVRKDQSENYFIETLGNNGEALMHQPLQIQINLAFLQNPINVKLATDESGSANLGTLCDVVSFQVRCGSAYLIQNLFISNNSYPNTIVLTEFESYSIPLNGKTSKVFLEELSAGRTLRNLDDSNLEVNSNFIRLHDLKVGTYTLGIDRSIINIVVLRGERRDIFDAVIVSEDAILTNVQSEKGIIVSKTDTVNLFEVLVDGDNSKLRAHLLACNYLIKNNEKFLQRLNGFSGSNKPAVDSIKINKKTNTYKSEARLADEVLYVYERKHKTEFMGNTLDKPGVILKRNKLGQTTEDAEVLRQAQNFTQVAYNDNLKLLEERCCDMMGSPNAMRFSRNLGNNLFDDCHSPSSDFMTLDFLANPGRVFSNIRIQDGKILIDKNILKDYSVGYLVVTDGRNSTVLEVDCKKVEVPKKDLRLGESRKKGFTYLYDRNIKFINKRSNHTIKNVANTEMCFISSLNEFFEVFSMISPNTASGLSEWKFIADWRNLSPMDKIKKYDKYASHELNVFLRFNDREFFDGVVLPFISNKLEKQLIDFVLIDDKESLNQFCKIENINKMNNVEKALLIFAMKERQAEFCKAMLEQIKYTSQQRKVPINRRKQIFDTILTSQKNTESNTEFMGQDGGFGFSHSNITTMNMPYQNICQAMPTSGSNSSGLFGFAPPEARAMRTGPPSRMRPNNVNSEFANISEVQDPNLFSGMQSTVEYNERQYFNKNEMPSTTDSKYYYNLALYLSANATPEGFFDSEFIYDQSNVSEILFILAFADLSFDKGTLESSLDGDNLTLKTDSNTVVFTKEIIQKAGEVQSMDILVAQRFFDAADPFTYEETEDGMKTYEKQISEYVKRKIYKSRIVVTNSTAASLNLNVLQEVPQGALPVSTKDYFKIHNINVNSFSTHVIEYDFYFPVSGNFTCYPATVLLDGKIVATANISESIIVKEAKEIKNLDDITDVISSGNMEDILNFMRTKNIFNPVVFDFSAIFWLLKNEQLYFKVLEVLRSRGAFNSTVWSYSIYHGDLDTFKELLHHLVLTKQSILRTGVDYISNKVIEINALETREYYPLVNPRAHAVGQNKTNILNQSFSKQYFTFVRYLFQKGKLDLGDKLILISYLICQDRNEEALRLFSKIDQSSPECAGLKLQLDYLKAYIDFISGYPDFTIAKAICAQYLAYPVLSWRNLFVEIANQLAEFEEKELTETMLGDRTKTNIQKAQTTPSFTAEVVYSEDQKNSVKITSQRMSCVLIKYYKIDLEILYSLRPFQKMDSRSFCHLSPFLEEIVKLSEEKDLNTHYHPIPTNISAENIYIQLSSTDKGSSKSQYLEYAPFYLNYNLNIEYGILKVVDPIKKQPVPKVYVKCFAMYDSGPKFYKDGYTDLRGSFDYVSLNTDKITDIRKFTMLITSKTFGSKLLECEPPVKLGRTEGEAKKLVSNQWANIREVQQKKIAPQMQNKYANVY